MLDVLFLHKNLVTLILGLLAIIFLLTGYISSLFYPLRFIERPKRQIFWKDLGEVFSRRSMIALHVLIIVLVILVSWLMFKARPEKRGEVIPAAVTVLISLGSCVSVAWRKPKERFLYRNGDFISAVAFAFLATGAFVYYMAFNDAWMPLTVANSILAAVFIVVLFSKRPWRAIENWCDTLCRLGLVFLGAMIVWVITIILKNH